MWVSSRKYCSLRVSERTSDEVISLYEFRQWYDVKSGKYKRHGSCGAKSYVVDVWPHFIGDPPDAENCEKFCCAKVLLHHPHCFFDHLLDTDIQDWTTFYQHCQQHCHPSYYNNPDPLPEAIEEEPESDTESLEGCENELFQDAWMVEAGHVPNACVGGDISRLGQQDIDEQHPWTHSDWTEEEITTATNWTETQKRPGGAPVNQLSGVDWRRLQGEQREMFLQVIAWYKAACGAEQGRNNHPKPLWINIDETAGTGKSFLIGATSTEL